MHTHTCTYTYTYTCTHTHTPIHSHAHTHIYLHFVEHAASVRVASARVKESLHRGILGPCGVRQGADIFDEERVCSCLVRRKVPCFGVLAHGGNGGFFQRALSFFPWYPSLLVLVFSAARAILLAVHRGCSLVLCFGDDLGCSLGDALHFFFGGRLGLQ